MQKFIAAIILVAAAATPGNASSRGQEVILRAGALTGENKVHEALDLLAQASQEITVGAESARIWHEIGAAHERLGDQPRAIGSYWRAIQLAEADLAAAGTTSLASLWNLATIYLKLGDLGRLDPVFDRYRRLRAGLPRGDSADGLYSVRFALLFQAAHKYAEAEALYTEGMVLLRTGSAKPELAFGLSNLGSLYLSQRRHQEAIACIREALEIGRSVPVALEKLALLEINLAAAYLESGKVADAALSLRDAAATMQDGGSTSENRLGFYWTSAKLCRKLHRKHDAALYMAQWKSLSQGIVRPSGPASIDLHELRARQDRH